MHVCTSVWREFYPCDYVHKFILQTASDERGSEPDEAIENKGECNNEEADQERLHLVGREKQVHSAHGRGKCELFFNKSCSIII